MHIFIVFLSFIAINSLIFIVIADKLKCNKNETYSHDISVIVKNKRLFTFEKLPFLRICNMFVSSSMCFHYSKVTKLVVIIIHFGLPDAIVSSCFCLAYIYYRLPYIAPTYLFSIHIVFICRYLLILLK